MTIAQGLAALLRRLRASQFARRVGVLASGTAVAQLISLLAAPILTRLYAPAEYGVFAIYLAIVTTPLAAICGRYEVAMVVARANFDVRHLLGLCVLLSASMSGIAMIAVLVLWKIPAGRTDLASLGFWLLLVPLGLFLGALFLALSSYANRFHDYRQLASAMIVQNVIGVATTLGFGAMGLGKDGLIAGALLGSLAGVLWLLKKNGVVLSGRCLSLTKKKLYLAKKYREFPLINAPTAFLDSLTLTLPIFVIGSYYPDAVVGYYAFILRLLQAPLSFLGASLVQVHLRTVSDLVAQGLPVRPSLKKLTLILMASTAPFAMAIVFFGPEIVSAVFGETWRVSGEYAILMIPALWIRFVASTVSSTFGATGNNRLGGLWKVIAFVVTAATLMIFAPHVEFIQLLWILLVMDSLLYILQYYFIWHAAGNPKGYV